MNLRVQIEFYDNTRYTYWAHIDDFTGFRCTREKRFPEVAHAGEWSPVLHLYQMRELEKHGAENIYGVDVTNVDAPADQREMLLYGRFYKEDDPNYAAAVVALEG